MKQPEYSQLIQREFYEKIVRPSTCQDPDPKNAIKMLNFDNSSDLEFYSHCFNEALRMQPPVYLSSSISMNETVNCGGVLLKKDDQIYIDMYRLHNNPKEWHEP